MGINILAQISKLHFHIFTPSSTTFFLTVSMKKLAIRTDYCISLQHCENQLKPNIFVSTHMNKKSDQR